jgi:hypothetical protein
MRGRKWETIEKADEQAEGGVLKIQGGVGRGGMWEDGRWLEPFRD